MGRIIDAQFHWHPPEFCELHIGRRAYPRARRSADGYLYETSAQETWRFTREFVDLDFALACVAKAGVTAVISSPATGGDVSNRSLTDAIEVVDLLNSAAARAQASHPDAFYGLAVLPMQDTSAALGSLERAVAHGLRGICMFSNINGGDIADRELWPIYQRAEELGLPVFLHPTRCLRDPRMAAYELERPLGFMFETSIAAMSLIVSGVMDAFPKLKIMHPHLGGTLPYLVERMETYRRGILWAHVDQPIAGYLRRIYFDTVSGTPGALALALEVGDPDHLLFATDFPYFPPDEGVTFVKNHLAAETLPGVFHLHAEELLGLPVREVELGVK
jgi:aminocarboxymuconate-semialdehyde decarboxylase